jgi:hypothetical protein
MTVYVLRDGKLVEKGSMAEAIADTRSILGAPSVSRMTPFESPVTGKEISSWRERDRDMKAANAFDARDLGRDHQFKRSRAVQAKEAQDARPTEPDFWR